MKMITDFIMALLGNIIRIQPSQAEKNRAAAAAKLYFPLKK